MRVTATYSMTVICSWKPSRISSRMNVCHCLSTAQSDRSAMHPLHIPRPHAPTSPPPPPPPPYLIYPCLLSTPPLMRLSFSTLCMPMGATHVFRMTQIFLDTWMSKWQWLQCGVIAARLIVDVFVSSTQLQSPDHWRHYRALMIGKPCRNSSSKTYHRNGDNIDGPISLLATFHSQSLSQGTSFII